MIDDRPAVKPSAHPCRFRVALAASIWLAVLQAGAQGIIYSQFPATPPPHLFPWDDWGYRVWGMDADHPQAFEMVIDGRVAYTFHSGNAFLLYASGSNAVIAVRNGPSDFNSLAAALTLGQTIGPDAGGYAWDMGNPYGSVITASVGGGPPPIGFFTGLETAYAGLRLQVDGHSYYGWVRLGAPLIGVNGGWIYDYAFQTAPDTPILAGQVPEPSAFRLLSAFGVALSVFRAFLRKPDR